MPVLDSRPELPRDEPDRGRPVAQRPRRRERGGSEDERGGERERDGTAAHEAPVVAREEPHDRAAPRLRRVDEVASAPDELLEPGGDRIGRKAAAREGEIGGGAAVELAEPPDAVRPKALRLAPSGTDETLELAPGVLPLGDETL